MFNCSLRWTKPNNMYSLAARPILSEGDLGLRAGVSKIAHVEAGSGRQRTAEARGDIGTSHRPSE